LNIFHAAPPLSLLIASSSMSPQEERQRRGVWPVRGELWHKTQVRDDSMDPGAGKGEVIGMCTVERH
jgi:hypothetical protein